ncbi:hypothetical protein GCM10007916_27040 [Psychromonas marina]|uniref:DUF4124 domain-containing protein n=1 Tax=Psychromonas marina TaxID=88364 RepID=A0ABQ6E374_9GAMM|nr:hypothetical protein [Psychromonas marina]GLS91635.1 hypothetical protein GCM10007916_27040 [Psychromonas marina]
MFNHIFVFVILLLSITSVSAQVYKCDDEGGSRYSATPCVDQSINLDFTEELFEDNFTQEERLIAPVYPDWKRGWKKSKDLKLERFSEVVYVPQQPTELNKTTFINKQKLTNLPQSMNLKRFVTSVEDIVDSVCVDSIFLPLERKSKTADTVYYGQYSCSKRRDTKRGELGYFKIIRGESSIYMVSVKWAVEAFDTNKHNLLLKRDKVQQKRISAAKNYLQQNVKLCTAGNCL